MKLSELVGAGSLLGVSLAHRSKAGRSAADESASTEATGPAADGVVGAGRFRRSVPALCVLGVTLLVFWRTGPGLVPGPAGFEAVARTWPVHQLPPEGSYLLRQALGQALYNLLGWEGVKPYLLLHVVALLSAGLALAGWLLRRLGHQRGSIAVCLLLLAPVTAVLLEWIGLYDAFSIVVWVLLILVLRGNFWLQLAVAVLGGLQNFEQFVASAVLLVMLPEVGRPFGLRARPVALLAGALAGKVVLELYLSSVGASEGSRAAFLANPEKLHYVLTTFAFLAPVIVFTLLGALWIPVLRHLPAVWASSSRSLRLRGFAAAAIVLGLGILSADHTRVMVLITFPLLVILCMRLACEWDSVRDWLRARETWLLLLIPPFVIVSGGSPLPLGLGDLSVFWNL